MNKREMEDRIIGLEAQVKMLQQQIAMMGMPYQPKTPQAPMMPQPFKPWCPNPFVTTC